RRAPGAHPEAASRSAGTTFSRSITCRPSSAAQELEQVRGQIVELAAAGRATEEDLDALGQRDVGHLAHQRMDPTLRLRAEARVGKPRRDRGCALDPARAGVELVGQLESVHVVVHRVEEGETIPITLETGNLATDEHASLSGSRTVDVGLDGRGD